MQSVRFHAALTEFIQSAGVALHAEVAAGAEVPFELESRGARRAGAGPSLYCYRPLTREFISERQPLLERLDSHTDAVQQLALFDGLDRYLASNGVDASRANRSARARAAAMALVRDVFSEQSDFELRADRLEGAFARLDRATHAQAGGFELVATLGGLTILSEEMILTSGLKLAHAEALDGLPPALAGEGADGASGSEERPLLAVLTSDDVDPVGAPRRGRAVMRDLLRALRLFGDGRIALGELGWTRIADGSWHPVVLSAGSRTHGMLVITPEQEDELRAFCNLVSRRAPHGDEVAWALARFELGCERATPLEGLTDHLLGLRALLEPEGPASGMLAGRLAALCAMPEHRLQLTERVVETLALERSVIVGEEEESSAALSHCAEVANHLRALLRDVICGHLATDLAALADAILLEASEAASESQDAGSAEQVLGYGSESEEILDLSV